MKTAIFVLSVGAALFVHEIRSAERPKSLFDGVVTLELPSHWEVQRHFTNENSAEILQILIPDPDTDNTPDSSNFGITAEKRQPGRTLDDYKIRYRGRSERGFITITEIPGGKTWLSRLSRASQDKTPYTVIDRLGLDDTCFVAFRASCPLITRKDKDWLLRFTTDCNAFIKSLKIGETNIITSELKLDLVNDNW